MVIRGRLVHIWLNRLSVLCVTVLLEGELESLLKLWQRSKHRVRLGKVPVNEGRPREMLLVPLLKQTSVPGFLCSCIDIRKLVLVIVNPSMPLVVFGVSGRGKQTSECRNMNNVR